ncbi:hypothetical protein NVV93_01080 [Pseudomonas sp. LS44]|uniref:hypothetical protein n=1 Tax=Pseudomonas sp. LS44 TaxID=1357074 RepID=UPI00215AF4FC|nr:hypothetical protein [Pseudomonas sp. LS44]UVE18027.1 hypothetical protein NVV93_01080 [Pseudomonas sp. LS44]
MNASLPIRQSCPPGLCDCQLETLVHAPGADLRVLRLTRVEEQRLLERLERVASLDDLERIQQRMHDQLGIRTRIAPGYNEVRSMRGIDIEVAAQPGLCRKTRQAIVRAIRRGLQHNPELAYQLLNAHDLLRGT